MDHIDKMCNKANSTLGFLRRNLSNCPKQLKELSYIALVRSKLEYAACVWNPYLAKDIKKIEAVQRRSARFVTRNYSWTQSVTELLSELGWETLEKRRSNASLTMMFKIINNEVAININEHLERSTSSTRKEHSHQFRHISTNTDAYKNSFFPRTLKVWNKLSSDIVNSTSCDQFKSLITNL